MTHTRTCTNPAPAWDGVSCQGSASESTSCNEHNCGKYFYFYSNKINENYYMQIKSYNFKIIALIYTKSIRSFLSELSLSPRSCIYQVHFIHFLMTFFKSNRRWLERVVWMEFLQCWMWRWNYEPHQNLHQSCSSMGWSELSRICIRINIVQ